ncbi:protein tramtrack, alpha isoform-like isoform X2 [Macrobrachium rosenbergii]
MERTYYKLKSDRHALDFVSLLDDFRLQELYCDATIACDGKKYPVHQVVLSACSPFFANIFASVSCQNPLVVIQDVSGWELEGILTYAYRGEVHVPYCNLQSFLKAGRSLYVKGLMFPQPEKRLGSESRTETWHDPYYSHGKRTAGAHTHTNGHTDVHGHIHPSARMQRRDETVNHHHHHHHHQHHSSLRSSVPDNGIRISDHLRRENMVERSFYSGHDIEQQKLHYMADYPQDLRVSSEIAVDRHSPKSENSECSSGDRSRWETETSLQASRNTTGDTARESSPEERKRRRYDAAERRDEPISTPPRFNVTESQGTFQELISGDEQPIKEEPEDIIDCNSKEYVKDNRDDSDEDEEESPLQIDIKEDPVSDARCNSTPEPKTAPSSYSQIPEPYSAMDSSSSSPGHASPTSHLRKELLRPVTQNTTVLLHQQQLPVTIPLSIPHPVIAIREPQPKPQPPPLREPPPLMKIAQNIPTLVEECEGSREPPRGMVKDMQASRGNSHLMVTAPPSYHSHNMSFEIHNQHLGPVLVNTGSPIQISSTSAFSQPKRQHNGAVKNHSNNKFKGDAIWYDSEKPLNLSGAQLSPLKHPDYSNNEDPFLGKIVTNRKKRLRGPKSWEFLVRLLKDPTTNPNLIRWENEANGIFRLVQPAIIAQRWGRRTGKHASENLSYENFARGLRYHYATGALKPVSEKSFVYRFGPKALKSLQEGNNVVFSQTLV